MIIKRKSKNATFIETPGSASPESQNRKEEIRRRDFLQTAALSGIVIAAYAEVTKEAKVYGRASHPSATRTYTASEGCGHPAHPFSPFPRLTLLTDHKKHRSRGSGLVILKDKWLFFWREANIHNAIDPNSLVKAGESRTGGQVIENIRTIYEESNGIAGTDIRARLMGNGRIGVFGSRRNAYERGKTLKPFFTYSDDGGETWSSQVLSHFSCSMSPSFTFNRYPASVGGHDTEGYVLFCHGDGMNAAYTTDNGNTWKDKKLFNTSGGEVSVIQLGDTNRWTMTCRRDEGENPVYKSTDLLNWDGPYMSGKFIGDNPSGIVYNKGHITWIAASRPYHYQNNSSRAIPVNGEIFKGLVTCTADAEAIWNDPTRWPEWSILIYLPVHFDGTFVEHQGHWYLLFGAIEGPMRAGLKHWSQLGIMSSITAPGPYFNGFFPGWISDRSDL